MDGQSELNVSRVSDTVNLDDMIDGGVGQSRINNPLRMRSFGDCYVDGEPPSTRQRLPPHLIRDPSALRGIRRGMPWQCR